MNKIFFTILLIAFVVYGQQQRIAIVNTVDDGVPPIQNLELIYLTDKMREIALTVLPPKSYAIMTQQSIVAFLGSYEAATKKCTEAEGCLSKLGREIDADYIAQARIGRFGGNLTIKVELYESKSGNLVSSFTGHSNDIFGLLSLLDKETPNLFKKMVEAKPAVPAALAVKARDSVIEVKQVGGEKKSFGVYTDSRDKREYKTVKIGSQVWMAENLDYNAKGSRCIESASSAKCSNGRLYNWITSMVEACPKGWRLPSDKDWTALVNFAGGSSEAGVKLKAVNGWLSGGNGSDYYGFAAKPGGMGISRRVYDGNSVGNWWSSTSRVSSDSAYYRYIKSELSYMYWASANKDYMFSVRCIKSE